MRRFTTLTWTTLDQGLTSLVSLGLVVVVANTFSPSDFGTFALVFAIMTALGSAYRIVIGTLLLTSEPVPHYFISLPFSWAVVAGIGGAAYLINGSHTLLAWVGAVLYLYASTSSITSRYLAYRAGRSSRASYYALLNASGLAPAAMGTFEHWGEMLLAFGATSALAVALGNGSLIRLHQFSVDWRLSVNMLRTARREVLALTGLFLGAHGVALGIPFLVASVLGAPSVAALRGGQTLTTAGTQVPQGLQPLVLAKSHAAYQLGAEGIPRVFKLWSGSLAASMVVLFVALMLLPERFGALLLGDTWSMSRGLLAYLVMEAFAAQLAAGLEGQMRAIGATEIATRTRLAMVVPTLVAVLIGAYYDDVRGAAVAMAGCGLVLVVLLRVELGQSLRSRGIR